MGPLRMSKTKAFASLEAQTRYVSEKRIKKWPKGGSEGVQARVLDLLRAVERTGLVQKKHRSNGRNGLKVDKEENEVHERQQGMDEVLDMIKKRVLKLPLPPNTQETDFDYENLLDTTRSLDSQVTANHHSIGLLRVEIEKEKKALAADQEEYEGLEEALKSTQILRKKQAKNYHPVAKALLADNGPGKDPSVEQLDPYKPRRVTDLHANDEEVEDMMRQLRGHLDSLGNNTASVRGLSDAILRSQSKLDLHAMQNLTQAQLDHLYAVDST